MHTPVWGGHRTAQHIGSSVLDHIRRGWLQRQLGIQPGPALLLCGPGLPASLPVFDRLPALRRRAVWVAGRDRPLFAGKAFFRQGVTDLSWTSDGLTLLACSSDGEQLAGLAAGACGGGVCGLRVVRAAALAAACYAGAMHCALKKGRGWEACLMGGGIWRGWEHPPPAMASSIQQCPAQRAQHACRPAGSQSHGWNMPSSTPLRRGAVHLCRHRGRIPVQRGRAGAGVQRA